MQIPIELQILHQMASKMYVDCKQHVAATFNLLFLLNPTLRRAIS